MPLLPQKTAFGSSATANPPGTTQRHRPEGRSQKPHSDNRTTTDIDVRPFGATVEKKTKGEKTDAETGEFRHNRVLTYPKDKHFDPNTAYFGKISEHRRTTRPKTRKTEGGPSAALRCIRSTGRNRKIPYFI